MTYRVDDLPADERTAFTNIVEADDETRPQALAEYLTLRKRKRRKAYHDANQDRGRRTLVGARIPRTMARQVQRAAYLKGESVYQFVCDALQAALEEWNPYGF